MKKVLICIFVLLLVACGKKEEVIQEEIILEEEVISEPYSHTIEPTKTWHIKSEKSAYHKSELSDKRIDIYDTSEQLEDIIYQKEAICLKQYSSYEISFKIASSIEKDIILKIQNENDELIQELPLKIGPELQEVSFKIKMPYYDSWNSKASFLIGQNTEEYSIELQDFLVRPLDENCIGAMVNQVGYRKDQSKIVSFSFNVGDYFNVYRSEDDALVYTGSVGNGKEDLKNKEYNFQGDFTALNEEGTYYILTETGVRSYDFSISDEVYRDVFDDALYFMYLQRCGSEIIDDAFGHEACHNKESYLYGYDTPMEVSGGWHDAGDYGRYVQTSTKALADLMVAYDLNQDAFHDDLGISESNNGIADVLDEIRYQLEWLLKLQRSDGSVHNKVTTESFANLVMPEDDLEKIYVLEAWTLTTASFAGSTAFGAILFEEIDPAFSSCLKEAALLSGQYISDISDVYVIKNPGHFSTGQYNDDNDQDERLYAFSALYRLTDDAKYLDKVKDIIANDDLSGGLAADMSPYGYYLLLKEPFDDPFYDEVLKKFERRIQHRYDYAESQCYFYPLLEYHWGSNQHLLDVANCLLMHSRISGLDKYEMAAYNMGNYVFGTNGLGKCFIDGYGTNDPEHIHHRVLQIRGGDMKGALVGGVDQILLDGNLQQHFNEDSPIAKRYLDHYDSYSTNELAIYYNSALVLYLSFLNN